jgi:hypothetical protein
LNVPCGRVRWLGRPMQISLLPAIRRWFRRWRIFFNKTRAALQVGAGVPRPRGAPRLSVVMWRTDDGRGSAAPRWATVRWRRTRPFPGSRPAFCFVFLQHGTAHRGSSCSWALWLLLIFS